MLAAVAITLPRWPLIGRRTELEIFEKALCSDGHTGLLIHGPAGVGKTRLADECREWAAASGHPTERVAGRRTTPLLPLGAVGAPVEGGAGGELGEAPRGTPLYVHDLVLGALGSGVLVEGSGVWPLEARLRAPTRLLDLVERRARHQRWGRGRHRRPAAGGA